MTEEDKRKLTEYLDTIEQELMGKSVVEIGEIGMRELAGLRQRALNEGLSVTFVIVRCAQLLMLIVPVVRTMEADEQSKIAVITRLNSAYVKEMTGK